MLWFVLTVLNIWVAAYWLKTSVVGSQDELRRSIKSVEDRLLRIEQSEAISTQRAVPK